MQHAPVTQGVRGTVSDLEPGDGPVSGREVAHFCCAFALAGRDRYSNRAENFKRPKNREDSSDLDENLTERIATQKTFI